MKELIIILLAISTTASADCLTKESIQDVANHIESEFQFLEKNIQESIKIGEAIEATVLSEAKEVYCQEQLSNQKRFLVSKMCLDVTPEDIGRYARVVERNCGVQDISHLVVNGEKPYCNKEDKIDNIYADIEKFHETYNRSETTFTTAITRSAAVKDLCGWMKTIASSNFCEDVPIVRIQKLREDYISNCR